MSLDAPTISLHLKKISSTLASYSSSPQLDAEILLAHALNISREQLYLHATDKLSEKAQEISADLIQRRQSGEPVAYITGTREFWSLPLQVTRDTLIPRPETELLVEISLSLFSLEESIEFVDLGTGSGAVALAIASERPHWQITATDKMYEALEVAKKNAGRLQMTNLTFLSGAWCDALPEKKYDVIVSNPPYLHPEDPHLFQNGLSFEPREALVSGVDGLEDLDKIISQAKYFLVEGGRLLLEHGCEMASDVEKILQRESYKNIEKYRDLSGNDRVTASQFFC
jgi:release factor glutamine methyltransferase